MISPIFFVGHYLLNRTHSDPVFFRFFARFFLYEVSAGVKIDDGKLFLQIFKVNVADHAAADYRSLNFLIFHSSAPMRFIKS